MDHRRNGDVRRAGFAIAATVLLVAIVLFVSVIPAVARAAAADERPYTRVTVTTIDVLTSAAVEVWSINNRGAIVGSGAGGAAFYWTPQRGVEWLLPGVPGRAVDVSDSGIVVGSYELGEETFRGFLWTRENGIVELGAFLPNAVNNQGQVAGVIRVSDHESYPAIWENGLTTIIGEQGGAALDINDAGEVTGQVPALGSNFGFVWSRQSGMRLLPSSNGLDPDFITLGSSINNRGHVVGFERGVYTGTQQPAEWAPEGSVSTLPVPGGGAVAINARGWSVGRYIAQIEENLFDWKGYVLVPSRGMTTLGWGAPVAINDRGDIVGLIHLNEEGVYKVVIWRVRP